MTTSPTLRIGDAERDAAASRLGQHFAAGRLDETEYQDRLAAALAARTGTDLASLFADLPAVADEHRAPARSPLSLARLLVMLGIGVALVLVVGAFAHVGSTSGAAAFPVHGPRGAFDKPVAPPHLVTGIDLLPLAILALMSCLVGLWGLRRRRRPHP